MRPDDAALAEWIRHVATTLPRETFDVPTAHSRDFLLLYGVCLQSARYASAYLILRESGHEREGQALVRAAFEHAVTAHWVYFVEGGVQRFAVQINRDLGAFYDAVSGYLDNEELRAAARERPEVAGKGMPNFTDIMFDLDAGSFLRTSYRTLSLSVHPTHATVSSYLEEVNDDTQLRHEPREDGAYPVLYAAAISSMLALSLVEYIADPALAPSVLDDASERLRLPTYLTDTIVTAKRRHFRQDRDHH